MKRFFLLVPVLLLAGCADPLAPATIPTPDLGAVHPAVRTSIEKAQGRLRQQPRVAERWGELAMVLDVHELFEEASAAYSEAHALAPQEFRWAYNAAVLAETRGRPFEEQLGLFDRALALGPSYAAAHFRRARLMAGHGELVEAQAGYRRALGIEPSFAMARRGLGQALLNAGQVPEAIEVLEVALESYPDDGPTLAALERARFQAGQAPANTVAPDAADWKASMPFDDPLRRAVSELGESPAHHRLRAKALIDSGQPAAAIPSARKALLDDPDDTRMRYSLALCLMQTGQISEGEKEARACVQQDPKTPKFRVLLGRSLAAQGRPGGAADAFGVALGLAGVDKRVWPLYAMSLARAGRLPDALLAFEAAASRMELEGLTHLAWGVAFYESGDKDAALSQFETAARRAPQDSAVHGKLGALLEEFGRLPEALEHYRLAVKLDPRNPIRGRLDELEGR